MIDYYGTKEDKWPSLKEVKELKNLKQIFDTVETATNEKLLKEISEYNLKRFVFYMSMHDFEALLFSDPEILAAKLGVKTNKVNKILQKFNNNPEAINNNPNTAPSKRIKSIKESNKKSNKRKFLKTTEGIAIAKEIGIDKMRKQCKLFDAWIKKLEAFSPDNNSQKK